MLRCLLVAAVAMAGTLALAQDRAHEMAMLASLDGQWSGVLEYRDYGSDERVEIPVRFEGETSAIAPVLTRRIEFTDPGRTIMSEGVITLADGVYTDADLSGEDVSRYRVSESTFNDTFDWSLTLEGEEMDGGVLSAVRVEQVMDGKSFTTTKRVRGANVGGEWSFRNEIRVERVSADTGALEGTWTIDLRPDASSEIYNVAMEIESVEDGQIRGTFYGGSAINDGRVSGDWGVVRFSFTTEDGTGTYETSGTLRGGRLEGVTRSAARGFVMSWRGARE